MSKFYCLCQITGDVPPRAVDSAGFGPPDGQCFGAPNRLGVVKDREGISKDYAVDTHNNPTRPVLLHRSMVVMQVGVPQEVPLQGTPPMNEWLHIDKEKGAQRTEEELRIMQDARQHFPNVDLLQCSNCGARIVREG